MQEDLVNYEQAKALKKLGFQENCLHYFWKDGLLFSNSNSDGEGGGIYVEDLFISNNKKYTDPNICDAPTIFQAAKWLRKKKKLYIYSDPMLTDPEDLYSCTICKIPSKNEIYLPGFFKTPEEAISFGISEAIKLLTQKSKS